MEIWEGKINVFLTFTKVTRVNFSSMIRELTETMMERKKGQREK